MEQIVGSLEYRIRMMSANTLRKQSQRNNQLILWLCIAVALSLLSARPLAILLLSLYIMVVAGLYLNIKLNMLNKPKDMEL
jgi:hypothetical protein